MPSQSAINALNSIDDAPDSYIETLLVTENKRLRAQVSELRNQLAESQAHIDALQEIIEAAKKCIRGDGVYRP